MHLKKYFLTSFIYLSVAIFLFSNSNSFFAPTISLFVFLSATLVLAMVPLALWFTLQEKSWNSLRSPLVYVYVGFWIVTLVSAYFGGYFGQSLQGLFARGTSVFYTLICVLAFVIVSSRTLPEVKTSFQIMPWLGGLLGMMGVFEKLGWIAFAPDTARVYGLLHNPIFLAAFLCVTLAFTAYYGLDEKQRRKKLFLVLALLQIITLLLTLTRATLLSFILALCGVVVYYLVSGFRQNLKKVSTLGGGLVALVLIFIFTTGGTRVFSFSDAGTYGRLINWKVALQGFADHPLLGVGDENFAIVSAKHFDPAQYRLSESTFFDKPHNQLLEVLVENGVFAFVLYVSLIVLVFLLVRKMWRMKRVNTSQMLGLYVCLFTYFGTLFYAFDTPHTLFFFSLLLGFLLVLARPVQEPMKGSVKFGWVWVGGVALSSVVLWYQMPLHGMLLSYHARQALNAAPDSKESGQHITFVKDQLQNWPGGEVGQEYHTHVYGFFEKNSARAKELPDLQQNLKLSQELLRESLENDSENILTLNRLVMSLINSEVLLGQNTAAEVQVLLQRLQTIAPKRAETHRLNAVVAYVKNDFETAKKEIRTTVELLPDVDKNLWLAGQMHQATDSKQAFEYGLKALKLGFKPPKLQGLYWMVDNALQFGTVDDFRIIVKSAKKYDLEQYKAFTIYSKELMGKYTKQELERELK